MVDGKEVGTVEEVKGDYGILNSWRWCHLLRCRILDFKGENGDAEEE